MVSTAGALDSFITEPGSPYPIGATPDADGVNFSLFSNSATGVELLLFRSHDDRLPYQAIKLLPAIHRTFHFWHVYVRGMRAGMHYAYRVSGPHDPASGFRFNPNKVLIDPYSKGNVDAFWVRGDACGDKDNVATSMRSVVIGTEGYDWEGDQPIRRPGEDSVIYELHVRGFTQSASSGVEHPGTFVGIIEKIPYLQELGITAVELLPVFDFDETEVLRTANGQPLRNYWGYSSLGFFAPQPFFCVSPEQGQHLNEFRDMVKALHKAGIEVILDVVFNHTNEGNEEGPSYCFKGVDNSVYYLLERNAKQYYSNFTGCGNTYNCNHPVGQKLIVDSLRYWVREAHIDGFRFDEGSILSRGEDGAPIEHPPVVWQIELDDQLVHSKVIAEAWDAAGLYQIGHFPGDRWSEWNGRFRDTVRRFVKGDPGIVGQVADVLTGSASIYQQRGQLPINSINFVTCHDGFTLNDLVSYNEKHNEANGEGNRDGINDNLSWNCGAEGDTSDAGIERLRLQQLKNFAAILMLSRGVPMILAGDEVRRTQKGNNNAYCQDNEVSWFDWDLVRRNQDLLLFWQKMIHFRKQHSSLRSRQFLDGSSNDRGMKDVTWHGCNLNSPGWNDPNARALAMTLAGFQGEPDLHCMFNMYWESLPFQVPNVAGRRWHKTIETAANSPLDFYETATNTNRVETSVVVAPRSIMVLTNS